MLEPTQRFLLGDALRPPSGFQLDIAVGTTFTLELDALLLATMSFAAYERYDEVGQPDPLALLESVRRHANNITVFAQAGALSGPRSHPPILGYLEDTVVPVRPPRPGYLFHPKVWALRFVPREPPREQSDFAAPLYRLIVMSRNLTFDASWDTIVCIDGIVVDKPSKFGSVIGDFIDELPPRALKPLDSPRSRAIKKFASDLRGVEWERPPGTKGIRFHSMGGPTGGPATTAPTITGTRILTISPFVTADMARTLGQAAGPNVLVSRASTLDHIGAEALTGFAETYVMDVGDELSTVPLLVEGDADEQPSDASELDIEPPRAGLELSGLHAKVYVTEGDKHTTLWLGSANATGAAFAGNVEFMVEVRLDPDVWTIDSFLDEGGKTSLRNLLMPYRPAHAEPIEPSAVEEATRRLDAVLRELAEGSYTVRVTPSTTRDPAESDDAQTGADTTSKDPQYRLDLSWKRPHKGTLKRIEELQLEIMIGPATLNGVRVPFADSGAEIPSATLQAITSFLVIEARTSVNTSIDGHLHRQEIWGRTLVNARLEGAPADRKDQLLAGLVDDPDKVLRYLLLLLADLTDNPALADTLSGAAASFGWITAADTPALLETLLRALVRAPESLDQVADFIASLQSANQADLLPAQLNDAWEPINTARKQLK